MKANRLISMLMLLINRDSITAPELAKIFGVDKRTIYRDVKELNRAGVPIIATPHRVGGGMSLSVEYKEACGLLSYDDIGSLLLSLRNVKSLHLETDNDVLIKRLKKHLSDKSCEDIDDATLIEIEIRFNQKHRREILEVFGTVILDIGERDGLCTAKVAFPDEKSFYNVLILYADRCECVSPEHIRAYVVRKIKAIGAVYGLEMRL